MEKRLNLADFRNKLSDIVSQIEDTHERVVVTKHGRDAVVVMAVADVEAMEETIALLSRDDSRSEVLRAIRQAEKDLEEGRIRTVEELSESLRKRPTLR